MNKEAILEIGDLIRVRRNIFGRVLTPEEIVRTFEYKNFKRKYPTLCRLAEEEV